MRPVCDYWLVVEQVRLQVEFTYGYFGWYNSSRDENVSEVPAQKLSRALTVS